MGTQTMGSHGGGYGGNASGGTQEPRSDSLARQGSFYNLTLDEVQTQLGDLGKPLSSMNIDELLKSVWSAEANQGLRVLDYGTTPLVSSLHRQPSLTLSRDLSKKTVDEVWQDIQGQKKANLDREVIERDSTLGDMTLEAFLIQAGVVAEGEKDSVLGADAITLPQQSVPHQTQWLPYQIPSIHQPVQQQQQQQQNMLTVFMPGNPVQQPNPIMDAYAETQMAMPSPLLGTLSDTQTPGRKRNASGQVVEKTVERRQKRMIKNRESAARSRARKQAYTSELENKVTRLEYENERLKKQKEVEKLLPCVPLPEPKYQLRRTSSASF